MVVQGHRRVAEGWELFEEAVKEAGPGDLSNLLHQPKGKAMLTKTTTHPPASPMEAGGEDRYAASSFTSEKRTRLRGASNCDDGWS